MTQQSTRFDAIDSAKGVGIILVVFGHAWRGAFGAGLIPDTSLFTAIDAGIYAFHMPLFFFLSGLLLLETLSKYNAGELLRSRVTRLLWPMALWTWLFFGFKLLGGRAVNSPLTISDAPIVPLPPYEHLWFLWALFLCQVILIVVYAPLSRWIAARGICISAGVLSLGYVIVLPYLSVPSVIWGPMVAHMPFLLLGIAASDETMFKRGLYLGLAAAVAFAAQLGLVMTADTPDASALTSFLLLALAWIAWPQVDKGANHAALRFLRYLGKASMAVYLTHTVFSAVLRIVMLRVGIESAPLVVLATTLIGLLAPMVVLIAVRRLKLTKLLGF